jgi:hypothetical protein
MKSARLLVAVAALAASAATSSISRDAHALGPVDLELGAKAGGGTNPTNSSLNPLGFGIGGRGGLSFFGLYAGVDVMYYLGGKATVVPPGPTTGTGGLSVTEHTLMYGADLGYNFKIALLTLRPLLGIGNFTVSHSGDAGSGNASNLYLEPGLTALVTLGIMYVGADANLLVLPGVSQGSGNTTETAFTLHGQVGVVF